MTLREPNLQTPSSMLLLKRVSVYFSDLVRTGFLNINYSLKTLRKEEFTAVTVDWSGNQPRRAGKRGREPWGGVPPRTTATPELGSLPPTLPPSWPSLWKQWERAFQSLNMSALHRLPVAHRWPSLSCRWSRTFPLGSSSLIPIPCLQVMVFFVIPQTPPYLGGETVCLPEGPVLMAPPPTRLSLLILPHSEPPSLFPTVPLQRPLAARQSTGNLAFPRMRPKTTEKFSGPQEQRLLIPLSMPNISSTWGSRTYWILNEKFAALNHFYAL